LAHDDSRTKYFAGTLREAPTDISNYRGEGCLRACLNVERGTTYCLLLSMMADGADGV
jgi:hypothetical protein